MNETFVSTLFTLPHVAAGVIVLSLNAYVLLAGADFGGGVWDLLAVGKRAERHRAVVADAIGPIWEANHVWLILVVVLLFTCFPRAFAHLATALHVPITLMLVGIVLRGSAFTFRSYDSKVDAVQRRWGRIFAMASVVTPVLLGICLGAVAAGRVPFQPVDGSRHFVDVYVWPWLSPFAVATGVLSLVLFAFLAAVYLAGECTDNDLKEDFRRRALASAAAVAVMGALTLWLSRSEAPLIWEGLSRGRMAFAMHVITGAAALGGVIALWNRRWFTAVIAAAAQASFMLWGWAWSQFPLLVPPSHTISELAAPRVSVQLVLGVLAIGTVILLPSFVYLFRVFKQHEASFEHIEP